jgi:hypothetical protein
VFDYARVFSTLLVTIRGVLPKNVFSILLAAIGLVLLAITVLLGRRVFKFGWRSGLSFSAPEENVVSSVVFYERLLSLMAQRGFNRDTHLTPLEFADKVGSRDAALITKAYNRVRFGKQQLSKIELLEINRILISLEKASDGVEA